MVPIRALLLIDHSFVAQKKEEEAMHKEKIIDNFRLQNKPTVDLSFSLFQTFLQSFPVVSLRPNPFAQPVCVLRHAR